jgi:hypothetical protein
MVAQRLVQRSSVEASLLPAAAILLRQAMVGADVLVVRLEIRQTAIVQIREKTISEP